MKRVVFRADVSPFVGLGHLIRCMSLSENLEGVDDFVLITRPDDRVGDVTKPAHDAGWQIKSLTPDLSDQGDALATSLIAQEEGADLVVTDLCSRAYLDKPGRLAAYHNHLRDQLSQPLLSIEDCRMTEFTSDVAIVPYDCGTGTTLNRAGPGCRVFAGTEFYICDKRLAEWRKARVVRDNASRILVAVGGSDPLGVAAQVGQALSAQPGKGYEVRIIAGHGLNPDRKAGLRQLCIAHPEFRMIEFASDIGEHLIWSDIAVLGEGLIRFEAAITGTPSVTISQFEHESDVLNRFYAVGTTDYLGPASSLGAEELRSGIAQLAESRDRRLKQSEIGMKRFDGNGVGRVAAIAAEMVEIWREKRC